MEMRTNSTTIPLHFRDTNLLLLFYRKASLQVGTSSNSESYCATLAMMKQNILMWTVSVGHCWVRKGA